MRVRNVYEMNNGHNDLTIDDLIEMVVESATGCACWAQGATFLKIETLDASGCAVSRFEEERITTVRCTVLEE